MRVAIFGRTFSDEFAHPAGEFIHKLEKIGAKYLIFSDFADFIRERCKITLKPLQVFNDHTGLDKSVDFFFSIGGDGTFLEAVTYVRRSGIPLVGINIGQLGFLAGISRDGISDALDALGSGNIVIEERTLLELISEKPVFDDFQFALNELTIQKADVNMITIHTHVGELFLNSYWADGLIISTPTGSTAYSLSVGGPILSPLCNDFIISPIAPHTLSVRPLLIPDQYELILTMGSRNKKCLVSLDHRFAQIDHTLQLRVRKADFRIRMVNLQNQNFFNTLRNKLMWGVDKRN
jgi:NAD+ kinase